jgi:hypothetical protein
MLGNHPKERIQQPEHGDSLKPRRKWVIFHARYVISAGLKFDISDASQLQ